MSADLTSVAVYRRTVGASEERVWENVHDWEHLPWLHSGSFSSIALVDRGDWGWKAKIGIDATREILLELVIDAQDSSRYVSRTLEGPGAGTEIWTTVTPRDATHTDVRVEFLVPNVAAGSEPAVGKVFTELYTRLWDEDEAMMQVRTRELARERGRAGEALDLGAEDDVRARLPLVAELGGRRVRVVDVDGELVAHSAVCPHWLGPLDDVSVDDGQVTCPWHGYRFDVKSGRRCDVESPMRLLPAPKLVVRDGHVLLEP